jgi:hypothetical protein
VTLTSRSCTRDQATPDIEGQPDRDTTARRAASVEECCMVMYEAMDPSARWDDAKIYATANNWRRGMTALLKHLGLETKP